MFFANTIYVVRRRRKNYGIKPHLSFQKNFVILSVIDKMLEADVVIDTMLEDGNVDMTACVQIHYFDKAINQHAIKL